LGLAIAKAIVEAHKGIIFAKNREGGGLSVVIILGGN
jgi:signal transduction histidine kinase